MRLARTDEQRALADTVRRVLADTAPLPAVRERYGRPTPYPPESWPALADAGVVGALVPEEYGGLGLALTDLGGVLEECGRTVYGGPLPSCAVAAVAALARSGDDRACARWLPRVADGSAVVVPAVRERPADPGWRRPVTTAARVDGGWRLTGRKVAVTNALAADALLVTAAAPDGLGLFVVERPAVTAEPDPAVDGSRHVGAVTLADAFGSRVAGGTADVVATMLDHEVAALVAEGYGAARAAFDVAVQHARTRVQFGRPVGSFQAVQHLLVDAFTGLRLGGLAAREALESPSSTTVATAKAYAGDAFVSVAATAIQVLGGVGYTWESDAHLYYKRLLALQTAYGTTAHHLERIASLVVDR